MPVIIVSGQQLLPKYSTYETPCIVHSVIIHPRDAKRKNLTTKSFKYENYYTYTQGDYLFLGLPPEPIFFATTAFFGPALLGEAAAVVVAAPGP
jgi:hypothetical protein